MTESEYICNELGDKYFGKDYTYENLFYWNAHNKKIELCDALFEYSGTYIAIQIKERGKNKGSKSESDWIEKKVYEEACDQIQNTVNTILNTSIAINDRCHQKIDTNKNYLIYPVIVFKNENINEYKRVIELDKYSINVFSEQDFNQILIKARHPHDILMYFNYRIEMLCQELPQLVLIENENEITYAAVNSEADICENFMMSIYGNNMKLQSDALWLVEVIKNYRSKRIKKHKDYKSILNILQLIKPCDASVFRERFTFAWGKALNDEFDFSKSIIIVENNKRTGIVFFAVGKAKFKCDNPYLILSDAKQLNSELDEVVVIAFYGEDINNYLIEWAYCTKPYKRDDKYLKFYSDLGFYSGCLSKAVYRKLIGEID